MKIKLSGYNVDADEIHSEKPVLTPETISAAYARISRDPAPIENLRKRAVNDVTSARKSNEQIIFQYGHSSIAEHAVLNFDISGLSRYAIEFLESVRLASYTEKSQRYQKLKDDYVIPKELEYIKDEYIDLINFQNETYHKSYSVLRAYFKSKFPELKPIDIKNKAKEDARYVTSLAMEGQIGMTINARSLENMIRKLNSSSITEVKKLSEQLYKEAKKIIPSLIRHIEPKTSYHKKLKDIIKNEPYIYLDGNTQDVNLLSISNSNYIYNALSFSNMEDDILYLAPYSNTKEIILKCVFENMTKHDQLPREFEFQTSIFRLNVSAACFAQLKRHRMASIVSSPYNILSFTKPESFVNAGIEDMFDEVMNRSKEMYLKIDNKLAAPYILPQATKRKVLVQMNTRELYAFAKLRMDKHAQWDIRNIATEMIKNVKQKDPKIMALACGKDKFDEVKKDWLELL